MAFEFSETPAMPAMSLGANTSTEAPQKFFPNSPLFSNLRRKYQHERYIGSNYSAEVAKSALRGDFVSACKFTYESLSAKFTDNDDYIICKYTSSNNTIGVQTIKVAIHHSVFKRLDIIVTEENNIHYLKLKEVNGAWYWFIVNSETAETCKLIDGDYYIIQNADIGFLRLNSAQCLMGYLAYDKCIKGKYFKNGATRVCLPKETRCVWIISEQKYSNVYATVTSGWYNYVYTHTSPADRAKHAIYEILIGGPFKAYFDLDYLSQNDIKMHVPEFIEKIKLAFASEFSEQITNNQIVILRAFPDKVKDGVSTTSLHIIINSKKAFKSVTSIHSFGTKHGLIAEPKVPHQGIKADHKVYKVDTQMFRIYGAVKCPTKDERPFKLVTVNDLNTPKELSDFANMKMTDTLIVTYDKECYVMEELSNLHKFDSPTLQASDMEMLCDVFGISHNFITAYSNEDECNRYLVDHTFASGIKFDSKQPVIDRNMMNYYLKQICMRMKKLENSKRMYVLYDIFCRFIVNIPNQVDHNAKFSDPTSVYTYWNLKKVPAFIQNGKFTAKSICEYIKQYVYGISVTTTEGKYTVNIKGLMMDYTTIKSIVNQPMMVKVETPITITILIYGRIDKDGNYYLSTMFFGKEQFNATCNIYPVVEGKRNVVHCRYMYVNNLNNKPHEANVTTVMGVPWFVTQPVLTYFIQDESTIPENIKPLLSSDGISESEYMELANIQESEYLQHVKPELFVKEFDLVVEFSNYEN